MTSRSSKKVFPNTYVIVFTLILLCAAMTWFTPGAVPQTWQVFSSLYNGFVKQAGIIIFILTIGGAFWILNKSGAVDYGIRKFISSVGRHEKLVLSAITILFSLGGAVFGMSEETIPFVAIVVPLVISMGYNAIVGFLIVFVAADIGFSGAFLNPFTVGIAQEMSDLPMFSGMGYRIFCWIVLTAILLVFILCYAARIKKTPDPAPEEAPEIGDGGWRNKNILLVLFLTVAALTVGVTCFKWYMTELAALFLVMGITCGAIAGFPANRIAEEFVAGAKDILSAAMVVGLASGIVIILKDGNILDPLLNSMGQAVGEGSKITSVSAIYGILTAINMAIPSATAKAAIVIPIMAPFSDIISVSRQTMVLAFQFGDGFTNLITPTSGVLMAALGMAKIQYSEWISKSWKYILALIALGFILLIPATVCSIPGFNC